MHSPPEILLVEDNVHDAELTIRVLKKANLGQSLVHLRDGAEALDFLSDHNSFAGREARSELKLILLDIKMPKVDGFEVLRAIKAEKATHLIPVVILTSSKQQQDMIRGYQLGVNSYVVKPVDFESFAEVVRRLGIYWLGTNQWPQTPRTEQR
jgi:two-component system response regulator